MIDLHTHILPDMDDGAPDVETAVAMLRMEKEQGVDAVALTPHFYRNREDISDFLSRRSVALEKLKSHISDEDDLPRLIIGAEVAWTAGIEDLPDLRSLCYENSEYLLIELPSAPWTDDLFRRLYNLMSRTAITPVIAHVERYFNCQKKSQMVELLEMGLPLQVSAAPILSLLYRGKAIKLLKEYDALLISDCHNCTTRSPNIGTALSVLERKLSKKTAEEIAQRTDLLLEEGE